MTTTSTRSATVPAARASDDEPRLSRTGSQSPSERAQRGKGARALVPRVDQGDYDTSTRTFDPIDVLERQSATRVPELVPLRYSRMSESPFRFYRGAAALMAADLARTPNSGLSAQLCGDAHMLNFRLLGSTERRLVFDINDFDETLPGPWEWDVKRLATSIVIAGRANGYPKRLRDTMVRATVRSYREAMHRFAAMRNLDLWYSSIDADQIAGLAKQQLAKKGQARLSKTMVQAKSRDSLQAFEKLTEMVGGQRRIIADPPLIMPIDRLLPDVERQSFEATIGDLLDRYGRSLSSERRHLLAQFRFVDMARKVVGVGSVGTRCWIILMLGRDDEDPLLMQVKEASESVLAEHVGASGYENQGQRVVAGQRLVQVAGDMLLGWDRVEGIDGQQRDFYVRQLKDWKAIPVAEEMLPEGMQAFGLLCGATLARAHARSGDRIAIASYLGKGDVFDRAVVRFAEAYADQNEKDHAALLAAASSGRVQVAGSDPAQR